MSLYYVNSFNKEKLSFLLSFHTLYAKSSHPCDIEDKPKEEVLWKHVNEGSMERKELVGTLVE